MGVGVGPAGWVIERAREVGAFVSVNDFARCTILRQPVVKYLAETDAFGSLGAVRRSVLWHALAQEKKRRAMPLFERPIREGVASAEPDKARGSVGASPSQ
jgi:hypothetical protein